MRTQGRPNIAPARTGGESDFDEMPAASLGGRTLVRTQTQYATAIQVQVPRDIKKVREKVVLEAELAGESFFYSWTTENKNGTRGLIEGVSIDGAMILARNWGNDATDVQQVDETPTHWLLDATFIDHETGFTTNRLFRQRKGQAAGKMDIDRAQDIAFQIGQSKAIRNVIEKSMPGYLTDQALETAKDAAEKGLGELPKAIDSIVAAFAKIGVAEPMLVWKVGLPKAKWVARDVLSLRALGFAIKDRQTSKEAEFGEFGQTNGAAPATDAPAGSTPAAQETKQETKATDFGGGTDARAETPKAEPPKETPPAASDAGKKKTREPGDDD